MNEFYGGRERGGGKRQDRREINIRTRKESGGNGGDETLGTVTAERQCFLFGGVTLKVTAGATWLPFSQLHAPSRALVGFWFLLPPCHAPRDRWTTIRRSGYKVDISSLGKIAQSQGNTHRLKFIM